MSDLVFFVNGKKIVKSNPSPRTVLAEYLRKELRLTGTKVACGEGACGACTVLISKFDRSAGKIVHYSANSCITPICSLHGLAITTVEAVGNTRSKLHPIQERLAAGHGVQCGFCSPGMVMSMFALLRNNPRPSEVEIEHAIKGNLCRCTGYRPIMDAFRSFAKGNNECPMGALCCQNNSSKDVDTVSDCASSNNKLYEGTQELIFPNELQLTDECDQASLTFGSDSDVLWRRPVSLTELLGLKQQYPEAVLAAGNTTVAYLLTSSGQNAKSSVVIATSGVKELQDFHHDENEVFIGAQTTMTRLENIFTDLNAKLPETKTHHIKAVLDVLNVFGSQQIRNLVTVGGSLAAASSWSDICAALLVAPCTVKLASLEGGRDVSIADFFIGKKTCVQQGEVILGVRVPFSVENEYFATFKQSVRRDLTLSDVTAAIGLRLSAGSDIVETICMSIGGTTLPSLKYFSGVGANGFSKVIGSKWNREVIEYILPGIFEDVKCESASDETSRYQFLSLQGFLLKFYLGVCDKLMCKQELTESDELYLQSSSKTAASVHSGVQVYHLEKPVSDTDTVGQPLPHRWAQQCTSGEAVFTDDILPSEGELYVALVTSQKPRARLVSVDPSAALALEGVVGYLDHKSVPGSNDIGAFGPSPVFAVGEVFHVGQTIGAVVASSQQLARLGASKVKVEYEDLPAILTIEDAVKHNSFHDFIFGTTGHIKRGDVDAGFKSATHVVEGQFRVGAQEHFYMETNGARVVAKGEDGEVEVFIGCQGATTVQDSVAHFLNVAAHKVTVHVKRMGGAFGGKELRTTLVALPSAIASVKYGRPARCILDRFEDMQMTGHRRPYLFKYKIGFTDSGKITAVDADIYSNDGFYPEIAFMLMNQTLMYSDNCYAIPNVFLRGHLCKTNLQSRCAMRGAGIPQAALFCEIMIREVSNYLKISALQVQQVNMLATGELTLGNVPVEASLSRCVEDVLKQSDYVAEYERIEEFNKKSKHIKRGIALVPIRFSPSLPMPWSQAGALVHIYLDGSVLLSHGGTECGQGLHTKMLQIASRALEAPIDVIHLSETSTNTVPNATVTGGSSGSDLNGAAVLNACATLAGRLEPFKQANPTGTWKQWVNAAYGAGVSLSCAGHWSSSFTGHYDWNTHEGQSHAYMTYGAGVTQVQLDCLTGHFTIPKVDIVMDVGKSLNPAIDVGQIEGAFVMGLGFCTVEDHRYNSEGRLETVGAGKYKIPSVSSIPLQMNVTLLKDAENQHAVYSSKGIGEPPLLTSSSVFLALKEAISAARVDAGLASRVQLDSPATVSRILLATHTA